MFEKIPSEYYAGFVTGVFATLLGFALTISWDLIIRSRDKTKKDNAVLKILKQEVQNNIDMLRSNQTILSDEIESIKTKSYYVTPLMPLQESMWQIISLNMPKKIINNVEILELLRVSLQDVRNVIEVMNSRENYRISNTSMTNYNNRMKIYDETLASATPEVIEKLEILVQHL